MAVWSKGFYVRFGGDTIQLGPALCYREAADRQPVDALAEPSWNWRNVRAAVFPGRGLTIAESLPLFCGALAVSGNTFAWVVAGPKCCAASAWCHQPDDRRSYRGCRSLTCR